MMAARADAAGVDRQTQSITMKYMTGEYGDRRPAELAGR